VSAAGANAPADQAALVAPTHPAGVAMFASEYAQLMTHPGSRPVWRRRSGAVRAVRDEEARKETDYELLLAVVVVVGIGPPLW
jgi:hypothetical protein